MGRKVQAVVERTSYYTVDMELEDGDGLEAVLQEFLRALEAAELTSDQDADRIVTVWTTG